MQKVPYMVIVGQKEEEEGLVSVRAVSLAMRDRRTQRSLQALKEEIDSKIQREVKAQEA